jgi:hypothetical protein
MVMNQIVVALVHTIQIMKQIWSDNMDQIETMLVKFIYDLKLRLKENNIAWARGYYQGQLHAYQTALMLHQTETEIAKIKQYDAKVFGK